MNFTDDQQKAIDVKGHQVLLSAAAGSGKTAVLVEHIYNLISTEDITLNNLLVLTFTDKAAKEMRQRLINRLNSAIDKEEDEQKLYKLTEQLSLINFANISTIHSFCRKLIKQNFHAVDIDPSFRLSDSENANLIKQEAILEVLEDKYEKKEESFLKVVENFSGKVMDNSLIETLLKLYEYMMSNPFPRKWLEKTLEIYKSDENVIIDFIKLDTLEEYKEILFNVERIIEELSGLDDFIDHYNQSVEQKEAIQNIISTLEKDIKLVYKVASTYRNDDLFLNRKRSIDTVFQKEIRERYNQSVQKRREELEFAYFYKPFEELLQELNNQAEIVEEIIDILIKFDDLFSSKKREKNLLDFNDLEHFAIKILVDENGEPTEIAKEYSELFFEIMIDEFQDTNLVQETILNSMLKDKPNKFMVGDVKQSIYRFRKANPKIFIDNYNEFSKNINSHNMLINLSQNFRSRKGVIDGTNYVFERLMTREFGGIDYDDNVKLYRGRNQISFDNDFVSFLLFGKLSNESETEEVAENDEIVEETNSVEKKAMSNHEKEAKIVAKEIYDIVNGDNPLFVEDKGVLRKVEYSDITILLRSFTHVDEYVAALKNQNISSVALNRTDYFYEIEVKTIFSILSIIDNKLLDIPMTATLTSEIYNISPNELLEIKSDYTLSMYANIENYINNNENELQKKLIRFLEDLSIWKEMSTQKSMTELLWHIFNKTSYLDIISASKKGEKAVINLMVMLERAKEFEQANKKGLHNFLKYIENCAKAKVKVESGTPEGDMSAVNIMTIHKSKGLEFKVVFLCSQGSPFNASDERTNMVIDDDFGFAFKYFNQDLQIIYDTMYRKAIIKRQKVQRLEEESRLLYVGMTRATDKLYISGFPSLSKNTVQNLKSICENNETELNKYFKTASNYLDFLVPILIKHQDFKIVRDIIDVEKDCEKSDVKFDVRFFDTNLITNEENHAEEIISVSQNFEVDFDISKIKEAEKFEKTPLNITISEIKEIMFGSDYEKSYRRPKFVEEQEKNYSAAERGTILHKYLENIDTKKDYSQNDLFELAKSLIEKDILLEEEVKIINFKSINKFINSELYERIKKSENVFAEKAFATFIDKSIVYKDSQSDEKFLLHGVIDLYFYEKDYIVLVDYKTDFINEDNEEKLTENYKLQLSIYKDAIEKAEKKEVREAYVYSFSKGQAIKIC